MNSEAASPKLFVSYSWTSLDHENWVIQLATYLRESGIDVILDKWDLKEGHDGNAFMEQMVTDPEIRKVILVCDKGYFGKADKRAGGVGTETQIITPQIYKKQAQDKFVAIVTERDDDDNAYIPAYYGSRIFIDLSDPSTYSENFERLLRWAFDEPLHKKPSLGSKPAFLLDEGHSISLSTSSRHRRATDSLVHDRPNALALVREYFEILTMEIEKFRIDSDSEGEFDDFVIQNIESFLPYRNEVIAIFCHLARNNNTVETANVVHQFMEGSIPYMERPRDVQGWRETDFDNYKFIIHELFLYAVACFIRYEQFDTAAALIATDYYLPDEFLDYGTSMISFEIFRRHLKTLEHRNDRLELRRLSLQADLLDQRSRESGFEFKHLMQADLVLFLRGRVNPSGNCPDWWPVTLLYAMRQPRPFEIFARSQSSKYFEKIKNLLGIRDKDELVAFIADLTRDPRNLPRWEYQGISLEHLVGIQKIATSD